MHDKVSATERALPTKDLGFLLRDFPNDCSVKKLVRWLDPYCSGVIRLNVVMFRHLSLLHYLC